MRVLDAAALRAALPWPVAIAAVERAFRDEDPAATPPRSHLTVPGGELLLMPAHGAAGLGVKLVTLAPGNPARGLPFIHGAYVLFSAEGLEPEALLDGTELTAIRTAAVSALATDRLARPDARSLVVFGAGTQARVHVESMRAVRAFDAVTIVGRTPGRAQALADELAADVGGPEAVAGADVVCTCTTSAAPLFDGALLAPGTHVNAIGAYRPDLRELDDAAMRRATVVVETRASALAEAGDVIGAGLRPDELVELGAVLRGAAGRPDREAITVFKSVGLALEDLAVARAALG